MGSLYRRGSTWWLKASVGGKTLRESTRTKRKAEARRVLRQREAQLATGERVTNTRNTWDEASLALRQHYEVYGTRNVKDAGYRLAHLDKYFKGIRLVDIDASAIVQYAQERKRLGRANATINVELATLRKGLRVALEQGKLARLPIIRMLR